jgi:hypothetical protein
VSSSRRRDVSPITRRDMAAASRPLRSARNSASFTSSTHERTRAIRSAMESRRNRSSSGINRVSKRRVPDVRRQGGLCNEIHPHSKAGRDLILQREEAQTHRPGEVDDQVDVAIAPRLVSCVGAKKAHPRHPLAGQPRLECCKPAEEFLAGHGRQRITTLTIVTAVQNCAEISGATPRKGSPARRQLADIPRVAGGWEAAVGGGRRKVTTCAKGGHRRGARAGRHSWARTIAA